MQTVIMEAAYSGSYSGQYTFEVVGLYCESVNPCVEGRRTYGTTDSATSTEFALEVKVEVSDFWPKEGSPYGGTLLTIYGWNFVDEADRVGENIVKIGHTIGSEVDQYCTPEGPVYRVDGSETADVNGPVGALEYNSRMQCRVSTDYARESHSAELILFASTFEEAVTNNISTLPTTPAGISADDNQFTFIDPSLIPTVTSVTAEYVEAINAWTLRIEGTDITDTDP